MEACGPRVVLAVGCVAEASPKALGRPAGSHVRNVSADFPHVQSGTFEKEVAPAPMGAGAAW